MTHTFQSGAPKPSHARVVALFKESPWKTHPFCAALPAGDRVFLDAALKGVKRDFLESEKILLPTGARPLLVIGLGEKKKWSQRKLVTASRKAIAAAKASRLEKLSVCIDDWAVSAIGKEKSAEAFAVNAEMAAYEFKKYLETPKIGWPLVREITYHTTRGADRGAVVRGIAAGKIIGEATALCRDLSNTPGGDMTPSILAREAQHALKGLPVKVSVLSEAEMKKLKMGGMLGVSRGSTEEAKLIVMEYGAKKEKPLVFLGKGITFDSGGLHIKPSNAMDEMHMDMSGGAAVIAAMKAIAQLKVRHRVIGIVPAVENMPSGESYRPGDILRSMSGKTIEVVSPDAEGRVVLADAMTYAEQYEPRLAIDVATLTGACVVALGHHASALLTPYEKIEKNLRAAGERSGDYLWPLPMWEEYETDVRGAVGDVLNASRKREAGTIDGGMFLWQFAKKFAAWAHIDIASTMTTAPDQFLAKGASGTAVRLLVEIARA
ncbi:leucyl aminopeptidase family protein [Candidatus Uhrbacteria bacterium]|nr:leucyl aminopeptidase family protein [Candidatus Uhrbacteria bacterium]